MKLGCQAWDLNPCTFEPMQSVVSTAMESVSGGGQVAIQEVRRLQQYGVTPGELERYRAALLRDNAQAAEQAESIPSHDNLDFVMESLALGHTVVDHRKVCPSRYTPDTANSISFFLVMF